MKYFRTLFGLLVLFIPHNTHAQVSNILSLLGPIKWSQSFTVTEWLGPGKYEHPSMSWNQNGFMFESDSVSYRGDTIEFYHITDPCPQWYSGPCTRYYNAFSIDTLRHVIVWLGFSDYTPHYGIGRDESHSISFHDIRYYVGIDGKYRAAAIGGFVNSYNQSEYAGGYDGNAHGWMTIGDTVLSMDAVVTVPVISNDFSIYNSAFGIALTFRPPAFHQAVSIFDLLGREVARIDVPVGAESAELNTSQLTPGLYIAQLGTKAVKFVVQ